MSNAVKGRKTLSDAELKSIKFMFDKIDQNKAGTLDIKNIGAVAKSAGCEISQDNAKEALSALDCAVGAPITFEKFTAWFSKESVFESSLVDEMDGVWLTAIRAMMIKAMTTASPEGIPLGKSAPKIPPRVGSPTEMNVVRAIFDKMDSKKVGTLDINKIAAVAKTGGCEMLKANATAALDALDCVADPTITFEKFSDWFFRDGKNDGAWLASIRFRMTKAIAKAESVTPLSLTKPEVEVADSGTMKPQMSQKTDRAKGLGPTWLDDDGAGRWIDDGDFASPPGSPTKPASSPTAWDRNSPPDWNQDSPTARSQNSPKAAPAPLEAKPVDRPSSPASIVMYGRRAGNQSPRAGDKS